MALRLGVDQAVLPQVVNKDGSLRPMPDGQHRADLPPGDAAIVAWRQAVR
jgi:hypothetical protein